MSTNYNFFEEQGETKRNRAEVLLLTSLPLGQTGAQSDIFIVQTNFIGLRSSLHRLHLSWWHTPGSDYRPALSHSLPQFVSDVPASTVSCINGKLFSLSFGGMWCHQLWQRHEEGYGYKLMFRVQKLIHMRVSTINTAIL